MNKTDRDYLEENLLSSEETCKLLGIKRQRLAVIIANKDSGLKPIKTIRSGNIYLKEEVIAYMNSLSSKSLHGYKNELLGYNTLEAKQAVQDLIDSGELIVEDIKQIDIYRYESDAIRDGLWVEDEMYLGKDISTITAPTFVFYMGSRKKFMLHGLNCGYRGEGPRGSEYVLHNILNINISGLDDFIESQRSVSLSYSGGKWIMLPGNYEYKVDEPDLEPYNFCCFEHQLVLAERPHEVSYDAKSSKAFVKGIIPYITRPHMAILTSRPPLLGHKTYSTVIRDQNGTELWLYGAYSESLDEVIRRLFKEKSLKTITLIDLFQGMGFKFNDSSLSEDEKKYLSTSLRIHKIA